MSSPSPLNMTSAFAPERQARRRLPSVQPLYRLAWALALPLALLGLWQLAALRQWMPPQILPAPQAVLASLGELARNGELARALGFSLARLFIGMALGVAAGSLLGLLFGTSERAARQIRPSFNALMQIPTLAWLPLLIMLLGVGPGLEVAIIIKAVLVPTALHSEAGIRDAVPQLREAAHALRLPWFKRLLQLILPALAPEWLLGLRQSLMQAWGALIVAELVASSNGIGYTLVQGRQLFQMDIVLACVLVIGLTGGTLESALDAACRRGMRWPLPPLANATASVRHAKTGSDRLLAWLLPAALLALWSLAAAKQWVTSSFLASPQAVLSALHSGLADGTLPKATVYSLIRGLAGLLLGGGLGLIIGLFSGLLPWLDRFLHPTLTALRQVAIFAWLPLITAWAGLGETAKLVFVALAGFFPLQLGTRNGARMVPRTLEEAADALHLPTRERLFQLVLPSALPAIFASLRLGLLTTWMASIGTAFFMTSAMDLGNLMINAQQMFRSDTLLACMLLTGLVGALLDRAGRLLEQCVHHRGLPQ